MCANVKTMTVNRTSVFPAAEDVVFSKLKELATLQYVAFPYATFTPLGSSTMLCWEEGRVFTFAFKLFGVLPFGTHTIRVIECNAVEHRIYTHESNLHVPIWNHRIQLQALNAHSTQYTDEVEIGAGAKTLFVWLWAEFFYAHRQRKWIRMLQGKTDIKQQ